MSAEAVSGASVLTGLAAVVVCLPIPTARCRVVDSPGVKATIAAPATNAQAIIGERPAICLLVSTSDGTCSRRSSSEIFRYGLELANDGFCRSAGPVRRSIQTMIDVVVDQGPLGFADGLFDRMKLLGEIET